MDIRDCSGCIVFRRNEKRELEYLVIRRAERGASWGFPKGGVEPNMSPRASAAKEVREEAGVLCTPKERLGDYRFVKQGALQKVEVFVAEYETDSAEWEEEDIREKKWLPFEKTMKKVDRYQQAFLMEAHHNVTRGFYD